ncbi:GNAT family N-acetyltransferase [Paenactinomyces guangxiensis]|uniref:GNAT family N-acetyltransferase n=1 Tax=Paenactinomyces guangxiensis TaxID=1490290 RepID=A0A7W2A7T7_9BACL|nr:GNAT family N-acetyltransferase [Paenactinomyces guangxiensis]MBA4494881.1 GNAT family N-acetyltransferase [Paenactinomyces guangxiensis]MBH8591964.1 GNAT family N-acetyltransferase [Paenactinomyces guangxiensis]
MNPKVCISPPENKSDWVWLEKLWQKEWGGTTMVTRGTIYHLRDLNVLIAREGEKPVGAITYHLNSEDAEIISLNALVEQRGIGGALLRSAEKEVQNAGRKRIWVITTNDNLDSLRFYQRRGYRMAALYPGTVDEARKDKPSIPLVGKFGIPLHDEIELEKVFNRERVGDRPFEHV